MRLSFRARLIAIVLTAALSLVVLVVVGTVTSNHTSGRLADIQQRHLPRLELGPRLQGQFERVRRALQDAVAAKDTDGVGATRHLQVQLLADLSKAVPVLTVGEVAAVRSALDDYYVAAVDVSHRLIAGETGERLVDAMSAMQSKQERAEDLLSTTTAFDRNDMVSAFTDARQSQISGKNMRLLISILCLVGVVLLSLWMSRGLIGSLADVAAGLRRFGRGDFGRLIPVPNRDEVGVLAEQANEMAASLERAAKERDHTDWVKGAVAGVAQEIRGELEPDEVANRALRFLARYFEVPVAALYYAGGASQDADARLLAAYGADDPTRGADSRIRFGEGLAGQAALQDDVVVVDNPPADYLRVRSGLGEAAPRAIVFVPLRQLRRARGVVELALFGAWSERMAEAMLLLRESLVIALEVALARSGMRSLLEETQRQAQRLAQQEDELRSTNEELQAQQEELRQSNHELADQRRALERNNLELDDARRVLEQRAAELTTVSAYKSQFLANMSHELRTPLNSMLLLSNLLAENETGRLSEKQVEFARTIHASGKDLLALINQVLDLAKIEAGKHEVMMAEVQPAQVAENVERIFSPLARDKGLELVVEVAPDVPGSITTDGQRVEQILRNFLGNAIKFTEEGTVTLRVTRSDLGVAFSVADTGVGIAVEDQDRIFAPFEQVDSSIDRRYGGTGLGLSISSELATLLGGQLKLTSELGKGSIFSLHLPIEPPLVAAVPVRVQPSASAPHGWAAVTPAAKSPLLVIEDDGGFADALAHIIRAQGLDCLIAFDGQTGMMLARERKPSGIILDVKLPDTDGWRVMEMLRADPATARIPVHFVTALDAADRAMALGAVGYLTKPASKDDLVRMVDTLTSKTEEGANRVLVVEDDALTGDSVARQLTAEKLEVHRARSAAEAFQALLQARFGCIVLDLGLPDMDGLDLLEALRARHGAAMPSVVIYTARALSKAEAKVLEAYTQSVVLKQGSSAERLLDEVRIFIRRLKEGQLESGAVDAAVHLGDGSLAGRKILITDDDMRTVYALSALLRAKGGEVLAADTGRAALEVLEEHADLDAILMDIMMPEMDGYEAMRRIRKDPRFRETAIIALTAKAMKGDQARCLEAGASDYLTKPVDSGRLLAMLQALLRKTRDGSPDAA
jgi:CheY-like chemotaxis protein